MGPMNRGGKGSNQYKVRPSSSRDDDSKLSDKVAGMNSQFGIPQSSNVQNARSADPNLEQKLNKIQIAHQNGDKSLAISIQSEVKQEYPSAYTRALFNKDTSPEDNPVYQDAVGEDDLDEDELEEAIQEQRDDEQDEPSPRELSEQRHQNRMAALLAVSRKDGEARNRCSDKIRELREKMNSDRMHSFAF